MNATAMNKSSWADRARKALAAAILTLALWVGLTATTAHAFIWGAVGAAMTTAGGEAWKRDHPPAPARPRARTSLVEAVRVDAVTKLEGDDCEKIAQECADRPVANFDDGKP